MKIAQKKGLVMNCKNLVLLVFFLSMGEMVFAQMYNETINKTKSYKVSAVTTVDITNKYGKIHVHTWEKDSVKFDIEVLLEADTKIKFDKLKSGIDFQFTGTEFYVMAKTEVGTKYTSLLDELKGLTNEISDMFSSTESNLKINYDVYMPEYLNVKINNKYGDVYMNTHKGDFDLNLTYGDFKANKLLGRTALEINFGDCFIYEVNNAKLITSYSEVQIKKAKQLNIDSKSAKLNLDEVDVLKVISKRDKYYVDRLADFFGETSFSEFWVYNLTSQVNLNMRYGHLKLESIKNSFSYIILTARYTDLDFFIASTASFSYEILQKNATIIIPPDARRNDDVTMETDSKLMKHTGTVGKIPPKSQIKIDADSGFINIYKQ